MAIAIPVFNSPVVQAFPQGGQAQNRSIKISDSRVSATSVSYQVSFKANNNGSNYTVRGIILDFCNGSSTPIIGDSTCTAPTGFTVGGASPTVDTNTSPDNIGTGWTATGLNNSGGNYRTLKLTKAGGTALTSGTQYTFTLSGVTNTSTNGTFYARLITYTSDVGDIGSYTPGTEGSSDATDYGGFALSLSTAINITAKVQETLTFCVSAADLSPSGTDTNCTGATTPNINIGTGTPPVLDPSRTDHTSVYMQTSTNAANGVTVRMKNLNTCANAGLSANGGSTCSIPGQDNTSASAITPGTAAFGLYVANSTNSTGGSGSITADGNYRDGAHTNIGTGDIFYGMDNSAGTGVTGTYGDTIATSSAPSALTNNELVFGATPSITTPAGIYTTSMILLCTGSF